MKNKEKFTKEWVELTLCNMVDDILALLKTRKGKAEMLSNIKRYSEEIYKAQK